MLLKSYTKEIFRPECNPSFKGKVLQAVVDSWCKIQVIRLNS